MACLDTDVLIELLGGEGAAKARSMRAFVADLVAQGAALSTTRMNVGELLVGVRRSLDPAAERRRVDAVVARLVVLEFDTRATEQFGAVIVNLLDRGRPIGDMDALIGSTALANGEPIVTRNARHFAEIPGLTVIDARA